MPNTSPKPPTADPLPASTFILIILCWSRLIRLFQGNNHTFWETPSNTQAHIVRLDIPSQSKTILTFPLFSSHLLLFITIKSIFLKWLRRHSWWVSAGNCYKNVASPLSNRSTAALLMLLQLSSCAFVKSVFFKNVASLSNRIYSVIAAPAQL